jgi:signal transduction histidine kinase
LVAATINLTLADEEARSHANLHQRIIAARTELEGALEELREVAHGIYPRTLARWGLERALTSVARRHPNTVIVTTEAVGRFRPEIEAAIYYCCLEAVQNATKHAGPDARVSIRLYADADQLHLEVRDDGRGYDVASVHDGDGLHNMRDRLGAVGGRVEVTSTPGEGTLVAASAPIVTRVPDVAPSERPIAQHRSAGPAV